MPSAPVPVEFEPFLMGPRTAVIATMRKDGTLTTTATWYLWENGTVLLNILKDGPRERNLRRHPDTAMTVLSESMEQHVSLGGTAVEFRDDPDMVDADRLSMHYWGHPYPSRDNPCMTVIVRVERWHAYGDVLGVTEASPTSAV